MRRKRYVNYINAKNFKEGGEKMKNKKFYVSMTDKFLSGWGMAEGKTNKLIFICDTLEEAYIVEDNALQRSDMKYVNVCFTKPYYNSKTNYVQYKTKEIYPSWYEKDYFKNERRAKCQQEAR